MGLFALYRVKVGDNQLEVFFEDVRAESKVEHICWLPDQLWLIREITDQLTKMGFELESDEEREGPDEMQIFATYAIPEGAGSSADAIRAVCARHAIEARIVTGEGEGLRPG